MNKPTSLRRPHPPEDPHACPHWQAARQGDVLVQQCDDCGWMCFPGSVVCSRCHSEARHWKRVSGNGTVESYCIFHKAYWNEFAGQLPYVVLQVLLDEGVRLIGNAVGFEQGQLHIGARVEPAFTLIDEKLTLINFTPIKEAQAR